MAMKQQAIKMGKLSRFEPYPKYKDSGVEWLGEIAEHWDVFPLRRKLFREPGSIKIGPFGSQLKIEFMTKEGYKVYGQEHVIARDFSRGDKYIDEVKFRELATCEIRPLDLIVTMMGSSGRSVVVPDGIEPGIMDSHLLRIRLHNNDLDPEFVSLLIDESSYVKHQISASGKGAIMHGLNSDIVKSIIIAAPPTWEQQRILAFLEHETAKIDTLVAKKERLIELLYEKRTALITRAVTKGLDPNVPMKDSGVEWLGEVPEHWECLVLKRIARRIQTGITPPTVEPRFYEDGSIEWFGPGSFVDDLSLTRPVKLINASAVTEGMARVFEAGSSMIVTIGATIGKVGFLERAGSSNQQITAVEFDQRYLAPKYGAYQLKRLEPVLRGIAPNTTLPILDQDEIGYLPLVIPPFSEQKKIIVYIDHETAKIDALVTKIREAIEQLKEYRIALISAAVTGKIDVREQNTN